MKKVIISFILMLWAITAGVILANYIETKESEIFTGYVFTNAHDDCGTWTKSKVSNKYTLQELENMSEDHDVYWIHKGEIDGIGIEIVEGEVLLVFNTDDTRLMYKMGPYKLWL